MGYVYYVSNPRKPSLAQLVERGTVVKKNSGHPRVSGSSPERGINSFLFLIGKFAQRSNLTKTELVTEPKRFFELLNKDEYEVIDARLVNDETVEVYYRNTEEFEEQNNKVNIVIAAYNYSLRPFEIIRSPGPITRTGSLLRYGFGGLRARTR